MKPTPAQLTALRLAARDAIRKYGGSCYSIPSVQGDNQRSITDWHVGVFIRTPLDVCVKRGWLNFNEAHWEYDRRWTITDAGRALLATMETT